MTQSHLKSLIETLTQIAIKFCTAWAVWHWLRPWLIDMSSFEVTCVFSVNSLVFGYIIRRVYNK